MPFETLNVRPGSQHLRKVLLSQRNFVSFCSPGIYGFTTQVAKTASQ
jgi:hypothetical protein